MIVGGSSYDHTDKLGSGSVTFIPGHYGQSDYSKFTVSDAPYILSQDGSPFATVGRWPVRTKSELKAIVNKTTGWNSLQSDNEQTLLIAENTVTGENINFAHAMDSLSQLLPASINQSKIYIDEIIADNPTLSTTEILNLSKSQILSGLNQHPKMVIYNGHGTTGQLSNTGLFKSSDIAQVAAGGSEIWLPLSCYVTYYESTHVNTLAHQLMFYGNAVSISGATLLSSQHSNIRAGKAILEGSVNSGQSIGQSVNLHKTAVNNKAFTINWALLGDPSLEF